jgi:acetyl esterase/lipase
MRKVAAGSGLDFAMFLYPRAPEHHAEETLRATKAAYGALLDRYGAGNVILVGTSAGGGLAVALMVSLRDSGSPLPLCSILLSPGVDMTLVDDVSDLEREDVLLSADHVRSAGRIYAGDLGPDHPSVSPINADLAGLPTMYVFVADSEILRPSIETFADRALAVGTEVQLVVGEGAQHTWPAAPTPEGRRALERIVEIVRACS